MANKISVFGSLNMDQVAKVDRFPRPGETLKGKDYFSAPGGKGANQAVAASRLGAEVSMFGLIGEDVFGEELISELEKDGVDVGFLERRSCSTGLALIQVDKSGENQIVIIPGANGKVDNNYVDKSLEKILETDVLLLQLEIPIGAINYLLNRLGSEAESAPAVILDPAPASPLRQFNLNPVDYLIPNEGELGGLLEDEKTRDLKPELLDLGVNTVIVTKGSEGASYFSERESFSVPGFSVEVEDTTAAGDAFAGAMAVGIAEGENPRDVIKFANAAGGLAAASSGAQPSLPSREEVEKFLKRRGGY